MGETVMENLSSMIVKNGPYNVDYRLTRETERNGGRMRGVTSTTLIKVWV